MGHMDIIIPVLKLLHQLLVSNRIRLVLHDELYNILGYLLISINLNVFFYGPFSFIIATVTLLINIAPHINYAVVRALD